MCAGGEVEDGGGLGGRGEEEGGFARAMAQNGQVGLVVGVKEEGIRAGVVGYWAGAVECLRLERSSCHGIVRRSDLREMGYDSYRLVEVCSAERESNWPLRIIAASDSARARAIEELITSLK